MEDDRWDAGGRRVVGGPLRVVFRLPLRQTEGFLDSLLSLMGLDLKAPDHTTLSRRNTDVEVLSWGRVPHNRRMAESDLKGEGDKLSPSCQGGPPPSKVAPLIAIP